MNATPTFTQFNFQNEEDLSFGMFDVPSATNHPGFHQSLQSEAYADAFSLHAQASSSGHISSQNSPFAFIPRSFMTSYDEHARASTPYLTHTKLESPGLSNGSSSTPETKESQQLLVTPKNASAARHVVDDDCDDMEEDEEEEDFDDDPLPLLSSSSARNKPGGKQHKTIPRENIVTGNPREREGKRRHFLQRNRVAAMKCRKKKKEWVNDLEETKCGLESQNTQLHMELEGLVDEASRIRAQLMVHANCNDANIDKWIENEAKRFVIGTGERYDQILAHAQFSPTQQGQTQPQQPQQQHQDGGMSSSTCSEYHTTGGGGGGGGPNLISPLATPSSQMPPTPHPHPHPGNQVPSSPAFYTHTAPPSMSTPGCYGVPPHEAAQFAQGLGQTPAGDGEPDYDGMPISLYDHPVS
ncbi:hypothetical protein F4782DRAFT_497437 [Xylaria castorea]|nr:hypothetical protein F4782DRAFT_497437 [Xylaria castorea]